MNRLYDTPNSHTRTYTYTRLHKIEWSIFHNLSRIDGNNKLKETQIVRHYVGTANDLLLQELYDMVRNPCTLISCFNKFSSFSFSLAFPQFSLF